MFVFCIFPLSTFEWQSHFLEQNILFDAIELCAAPNAFKLFKSPLSASFSNDGRQEFQPVSLRNAPVARSFDQWNLVALFLVVLSRYFHMLSRFTCCAFQKLPTRNPTGAYQRPSRGGLRRAPEPVHPPSTSPLGEFATTTVVSPSRTCACARARVGTYPRQCPLSLCFPSARLSPDSRLFGEWAVGLINDDKFAQFVAYRLFRQ